MGAYLTQPNTEKITIDEECSILKCGHGSMQGWRLAQEDAHNCILEFDENTSLFSVYDGHGGAEVANYCSLKFPQHLKTYNLLNHDNLEKALQDSFLSFDATLLEKQTLAELHALSAGSMNMSLCEDYDEEDNISDLREEAQMPLNEVLEKYRDSKLNPFIESLKLKESTGDGPSCSKSSSAFPRGRRGGAGGSSSGAGGSGAGRSGSSSDSGSGSSGMNSAAVDGSSSSNKNCGASSSTSSSSPASKQTENNVGSSSSKVLDAGDAIVSSSSNKSDASNKNEPTSSTTECEIPDSSSSTKIDTSISDENTITEGNGEPKIYNTNQRTNGDVTESSSSTKNADGDNEMEITTNNKSTKTAENVSSSSSLAPVGPSDSAKPENGEVSSNSSNCNSQNPQKQSPNNISSSNNDDENDSSSDDDDEDVNFNEEANSSTEDGEEDCELDDEEDEEEDSEDAEEEEDEEEEDVNQEDEAFMSNMSNDPGFKSGCTAVVALLKDRELYVANAGDSRCVLCRNGKPIEMSLDHKPEDQIEFDRIKNAGGRVTLDGRVNGGLNLSRAIGDHGYKMNKSLSPQEQMISALPDVKRISLTSEDEFMVLACDGIWNFMTSDDVIAFVKTRIADSTKKLSKICEELFDKCLAPHSNGDGTGCDNMTAIIVQFKPALFDEKRNDVAKKRASSPEAVICENVIKKQKLLDDENETAAAVCAIAPETSTNDLTKSEPIAADTSST